MKRVMIFLMCLEAANVQKSHLKSILESKDNIFDTMNSNIYTTMNKLFKCLKLDKSFTSSVNVQMLLIMSFHYYKITEKTYEVHEKLKNISAVNHNTSNYINLKEIFNDIVKDEIDKIKKYIANITNIIFEKEIASNKTEKNSTEDTLEKFNEFWSKFSDRTIESLLDPILNETEIPRNAVNSFYTHNKSREIKSWKPPTSVDLSWITSNNTRRIYKGKKTKIKSYPFLVSIHIMSDFMCAGSVISKDMVITAASCLQIVHKNKLYRDNPRSIFVRVASDYTKRSGELIPIVEVFFHPQYDPITLRNNVAIVKMLENIKHIKKRKIKRIKYDRRAEALADDGTEVTILGWGAKDEKHLKPNDFQRLAVADLDIYDINDCKEVYSKYYVTETNFCAGFTYKGGGACMGDVGGPAVISGELVGLISFGPTVCGLTDAPTVFTKVGFYAQWIDSVLTQKPIARQREVTTTDFKQPDLFIVPLYTTVSPNNVLEKRVTKRKMRAKTTDYPEEVKVLKKIIQEYILANSSVVEYLLNGDILEDEETVTIGATKNYLFLDPAKYKAETEKVSQFHREIYKPTTPVKIIKPYKLSTIKPVGYRFPEITTTQTTGITITTHHLTDYDYGEDTRKKTTLLSVFDSNDWSENDRLPGSNEKVLRQAEESSSYYEEEIPIEVTKFSLISKHDISEQETKTTSANQWPKTTRLLTNAELNENKTYTNNKPKHELNSFELNLRPVEKEIDRNEKVRSVKVTNIDKTTTMMTWPLGVTMPISDEDFEYMNNQNEKVEQPSSREMVHHYPEQAPV